ncbi:protein kinase [Aquimonas sp.]|jgi:serine/threonine protein kinase|uniref:serine/threonine-protein kinase n=1 Tax=Aquimonas sp. TaxID=1872588 RepID=UPI0037BF65B8
MSDTPFSALSEAFDRIVQLPIADRAGALAALPEALRAEVERLLAADTEPDDPLQAVLEGLGEALQVQRAPGARLGPWRILRELGAGGMGTVLLAERADGQFQQQAAIKLIRGFPTQDGRRRLRQERQILAQLDHPGIARLLDGGETADGQPWVAMEYVDGLPLVAHVARYRPDLHARLELFDHIAEAVEHAHQRLVIHRDLKPGNVLVRNDGRPKLLDFGVAKLIDLGQDSARRDTSTRVWTPGYASPEQRQGQPITTASDVYGLGVLLGEMLQGDTAHREGSGFPSLPPDAELRGVIAMATAEDPLRRYPTVEALREELRRYRHGRPLRASADTGLYRLRKFARRHRLQVALVALSAVLLLAFVWRLQVERADALMARTLAEQAQASQALQFRFLATIFQGAAGRRGDGSPLLAVDLIDRARDRLGSQLGEDPRARTQVEQMLGSAYLNAGRYADSYAMYLAAAEHGQGHIPDSDRAAFIREAARSAERQGRGEEALRLLEQAQQLLGPPPYSTEQAQTAVRIALSRILNYKSSSDPRYQVEVAQAVANARAWLPADDALLALMLGEQAALAESAGDLDELVAQRREIVEVFLRSPNAYASDIAVQRLNLVRALALTAALDEAEAEMARAMVDLDGSFADADHPTRAWALLQRAQLMQLRGERVAALQEVEHALSMLQRLNEPPSFGDLIVAGEIAASAGASARAREWLQGAAALARNARSRARIAAALATLSD